MNTKNTAHAPITDMEDCDRLSPDTVKWIVANTMDVAMLMHKPENPTDADMERWMDELELRVIARIVNHPNTTTIEDDELAELTGFGSSMPKDAS